MSGAFKVQSIYHLEDNYLMVQLRFSDKKDRELQQNLKFSLYVYMDQFINVGGIMTS